MPHFTDSFFDTKQFSEIRSVARADVAELVAFFASSKSSKTTGAQIPVDGGNDRII